MSKAEDRYLDYFLDGRLRNCSSRDAFLYGYRQAEKDLELTVKDIKKIYHLVNEVSDDLGVRAMYVNIYQEALKRFKDLKDEEIK